MLDNDMRFLIAVSMQRLWRIIYLYCHRAKYTGDVVAVCYGVYSAATVHDGVSAVAGAM